jgi:threonylcarbamoyladenosine tRNA methylthiotransferase MtaB
MLVHNKHKDSLVAAVEQELLARGSCTHLAAAAAANPDGDESAPPDGGPQTPLLPAALALDGGRTRAVLKVQDGCNAGCSFCIIPRARGGPRSVPLEEAVAAARALEAQGYREIVLAGILLGSYGGDLAGHPDLGTLLARILAATRSLRLRISSIEPQDLAPAWFDLWRDERMCRHLHLPLQSGSATTLRAMRRKYGPDAYASLVAEARRRIPGLAVTADVMVGFPGEVETLFAESAAFIRRIGFAGLHVFKYSPRAGTPARRYPDQVDEVVKQERSACLRALAAEGARAFHKAHEGTAAAVLWQDEENGIWRGLTDNYLQVRLAAAGGQAELANTLMACRLVRAEGATLWAAPLTGRDPAAAP